MQQAAGHAAGEGAADAGQHRQPRPQRVARRRVRVVRQRVDEEVGQPVPREVRVGREPRREHQALGGDAAPLGLAPQVACRRRIVLEQPQHAARDARSSRIQSANISGVIL